MVVHASRTFDIRYGDAAVASRRSARGGYHHQHPAFYQLAAKRVIDVLISSFAIVVLSPFLLVVALLIRLESRGAALFRQERWGRNGQRIFVLKFRTMRIDACDHSGVSQTIAGDPRVTRLGAFLRRTNIDELPQLWNVLIGDMSLVGPRCHPIGMLAAGKPFEDLVPSYHRRHAVRPGITGLAQVRGLRGPTTIAHKARARIACDIYYVENLSLILDAKILIGTLLNEIRGGTGY